MEWFSLSTAFSSLVTTVIMMLLGVIISKVLSRATIKVLGELELNFLVKKVSGVKVELEEFTGTLISAIVYFITGIMILRHIGIETIVLNVLFAGVVIFIVISLLLALRDMIPNAFAGLVIAKRRQYSSGQVIKVEGVEGKIKKITSVQTIILTKRGDTIYIPNSTLLWSNVIIKKK